jgi:ABC-type branched-subunit amino acid transport system substrate-binding protein
VVSVLLLAVSAIGCSTTEKPKPIDRRFDSSKAPHSADWNPGAQQAGMKEAPRLPWEIWPLGADIDGAPLTNPTILRGDDLVRYGERVKGLAEYQRLNTKTAEKLLSETERATVVLRVSSTQLALNQPEKALSTLSKYFSAKQLGVEQVDSRFSLIFAFAYARHGDISQSIAWFSRSNRLGASRGLSGWSASPGTTSSGLRLVLRSLPTAQLHELQKEWSSDTFVRVLIGEEVARRAARGGYEPPAGELERSLSEPLAPQVATAAAVNIADIQTIGVLLPLSGRFASLGVSFQRGLELGFEAARAAFPEQKLPELKFVDTTDDALVAVTKAQELVATPGVGAIVGPVLSEHAVAVSNVVRESQIPLLVLSKSMQLATGGNILRLAPTSQSQADSLVGELSEKLRATKYTIVAPDDDSASELVDAFRAAVEASGGVIEFEVGYKKGDFASLSAAAESVEQRAPQIVFVPDSILSASRFISGFSPEARRRILITGPLLWDDDAQLANSRSAMQGAIFVTPFHTESLRPEIAQFVATFQSRFGKRPDFLAAQGFDVASILVAALRRGDAPNYLRAIQLVADYDGLTGRVSVGESGELQRRFVVVQYLSGRRVPLDELLSQGFLKPFIVEAEQPIVYRGNARVQ